MLEEHLNHCRQDDVNPLFLGYDVSLLRMGNAMKTTKTNIWKGQADTKKLAGCITVRTAAYF